MLVIQQKKLQQLILSEKGDSVYSTTCIHHLSVKYETAKKLLESSHEKRELCQKQYSLAEVLIRF